MPIRAGDAIERAQVILNDNAPAFVRWPELEMLDWLNDGAAEIVLMRPAAGAITESFTAQAGSLQRIPEGGIELLDIPRNLLPDGSPGRVVTRTDRDLLDGIAPDWHSSTLRATAKHFTFDERTPDRFYCYPPLITGTKIEIVYSKAPPLVDSLDAELLLDRAYMGPLVSYLVFRCASKDSEYADAALAIAHQQLFTQALSNQNATTNAASPNVGAQ